jgi:hypothetical protein
MKANSRFVPGMEGHVFVAQHCQGRRGGLETVLHQVAKMVGFNLAPISN